MSDWKEGAVKRRDARHTKTPDPSAHGPKTPKPSKKDTKKWCRGKVGVKHVPVCKTYAESKNLPKERVPGVGWLARIYKDWFVLECSKCGKQLAHYSGKKENRPDWVKVNA